MKTWTFQKEIIWSKNAYSDLNEWRGEAVFPKAGVPFKCNYQYLELGPVQMSQKGIYKVLD